MNIIKPNKFFTVFSGLALSVFGYAQQVTRPTAGANELTPSRSQYFSWINNTNEGSTEVQTMTNLEFFRWLYDEYGMVLDIYAFDAGQIDGAGGYGSMDSDLFRKQYPSGFHPLSIYAGQMGTRFGLWCGPDGFGETEADARKRMDMMTGLVRDDGFTLFKMDAVCGHLRPEKWGYFDEMMTEIRKIDPDFILLNHRLDLGPGTRHSTTYLLGGAETYIDVFMANTVTAPHHRAGALARELPEGMTRLSEDHGVCISSCLDFWQDDLILQAFNRNLILSPQVYGNPWLLRDDEFAELAYIYNLHRDYRDILVEGMRLPEKYGYEAVSRGDGETMFLTLRNLSWDTVSYKVKLDEEIGLTSRKDVKVRQYHPYIIDKGIHKYGSEINVEVLPFRSCLIKVTVEPEKDAVALSGIPYKIVRDRTGKEYEVRLLGNPGMTYKVKLENRSGSFRSARLDGKTLPGLHSGKTVEISFDGVALKNEWHRQLPEMHLTDVSEVRHDLENLYYATCFAADNSALEARSLERSGETSIPQVKAARDAFFNQSQFVQREIWDRYAFDNDPKTAYSIAWRFKDVRQGRDFTSFMLDFGKKTKLDSLSIHSFDVYSISPLKVLENVTGYVSADLKDWKPVRFRAGVDMKVDLSGLGDVRYFRFYGCPLRISEIYGYKDGKTVERTDWSLSNLFGNYRHSVSKVWKSEFVLDEIPKGSYLCVAVNGIHGVEGAWAGFKIDGEYAGCPDRAPSFNANAFECPVKEADRNYTYYLPLDENMKGKKIEAFVMAFNEDKSDLNPEVWITNSSNLISSKTLLLTD